MYLGPLALRNYMAKCWSVQGNQQFSLTFKVFLGHSKDKWSLEHVVNVCNVPGLYMDVNLHAFTIGLWIDRDF